MINSLISTFIKTVYFVNENIKRGIVFTFQILDIGNQKKLIYST